MHITANCSAGFAGQCEQYDIDTKSHRLGSAIEALLGQLDFFAAIPPDVIGADIPSWNITVNDGTRAHSITFADDGGIDAARWQALMTMLRSPT